MNVSLHDSRLEVEAEGERLILTNLYVECTRCKQILPIERVGLRRYSADLTRNQPQCSVCRGEK